MNDLKEELFSKVIKAGTKRTYFIDVKESKNGSVFLQFSKSFLKPDGINSERSKIIIHKEDLLKISEGLNEALLYIKNGLKIEYY